MEKKIKKLSKYSMNTYLFKIKDNNIYKIGRSKEVDNRLKSIQYQYKIKLEKISYCYIDIEQILHKYFNEKRMKFNNQTEWFNLNEEDINYIKNKFEEINNKTIQEQIEINNTEFLSSPIKFISIWDYRLNKNIFQLSRFF